MTSLVNTIRSLYEKKEVEEVSIDEAFETLDLEESDLDEVLDSPKAMKSYRDKARASKEKAASSAVAKMNKGTEKGHRVHPAGELKTIAKRAAGERMANKKVREEVDLDEAKDYEYKDGKAHISKANFRKVHKDFKNTTRGKERMVILDPKTQATISVPVVFTEDLDEAKNKNPFKYYKKPSNKKEAQSNVNYWHYEGMLSNKDIEDMGKIPANYKSFIKTMKQEAERDLKKFQEEVDLDEAKMTDAKNKEMMRKALGVSKLGPKHAHYTTAYANNGDFVVRDGGGRVVGRITKDELNEDLKENYRMERMGVSRSLVDAVRNVLSGKPQEEALDKVNPDAVKKKFKDRNDKDIDNDGDVDDSDEYLHKRRQAVSKAIAKGEEKEDDKDVKNGKKEKVTIDPPLKEAQMTDAQMKKREDIVKSMKKKKSEFIAKYGDKADDVMYATATKMAMKEAGPKLGTDSLKTMRAKDKAHADAMGRHVASGRKKSK